MNSVYAGMQTIFETGSAQIRQCRDTITAEFSVLVVYRRYNLALRRDCTGVLISP